MNEDFAPFELAVKLKEKGFELRTRYGYIPPIKLIHEAFTDKDWTKINGYAAPTISQVLKWLRKEKKIHIIVEIADSGWYYTIYPNIRWENDKLKSDKYIMSFKHKASYEQATVAGIEYVLDKWDNIFKG